MNLSRAGDPNGPGECDTSGGRRATAHDGDFALWDLNLILSALFII